VQIVSKEVGLKTDLLNGRVVVDFAVFRTVQTNQAVFSGLTNPQGVGYYLNVGTTTNEGWDSSVAVAPLPGLQVIATGYVGTVKNQANTWVSPGFGNMLTLFFKYEMPKDTMFKDLAFGGGFSRVGSRYITTGGETFPVGYVLPAFFKMHEGTESTFFLDYQFTKNLSAHLSCVNLLDDKYPMGSQSPGVIDPAVPRDYQLTLTIKF
jgi:outer membrane receptor for ferric coprogen and ferric-rhodotorulic acid